MERELLAERIDHLLHLFVVCKVIVAQKDDVMELVRDSDACDGCAVENNRLVELVCEA